jgi:hypothetical protein
MLARPSLAGQVLRRKAADGMGEFLQQFRNG